MSGLLELAARCEAAEGPDHDLTEAIARAVGGDIRTGPILPDHAPRGFYAGLAYTYSIDAAMSLVPEECGHNWSLIGSDKIGATRGAWQAEVVDELADAATPALALCAAALKARASA